MRDLRAVPSTEPLLTQPRKKRNALLPRAAHAGRTFTGGHCMDFQVSALPLAEFQPLFALSDAELAERHIVRHVADKRPGFPCRVSLRDAEVGERLLLLNYEHLAVASPFRSSHAIYVRENAVEAHPEVNEIPDVMVTRLLSVRAFDDAGMMCAADVVPGKDIVPLIERLFGDAKVAYLHVHNARLGCFFARIDRR
jgi:Protein of unknown function (DUF1203)